MTFSRNSAGNWLMAVTSRYKFIVSNDSNPCLFDLDADPFEMRNIFSAPSSRETVRELARALADYDSGSRTRMPTSLVFEPISPGPPMAPGDYVAPQRHVKKAKARQARDADDDQDPGALLCSRKDEAVKHISPNRGCPATPADRPRCPVAGYGVNIRSRAEAMITGPARRRTSRWASFCRRRLRDRRARQVAGVPGHVRENRRSHARHPWNRGGMDYYFGNPRGSNGGGTCRPATPTGNSTGTEF